MYIQPKRTRPASRPKPQGTPSPSIDGAGPNGTLDAESLRRACLQAGADDVGFVDLDREEIADQRADILAAFPRARTLISYVVRMNPDALRSPPRSIANLEFHHTGDEVNEVGRRIVDRIVEAGGRALVPAMGFPMEADRFPGKIWIVSHKPIAVAAGLGRMGIHRNVIHPVFGNFILLGTVLTDRRVSEQDEAIDYNPCLECRLCVAACPTGAIGKNGEFDFSACYTHNYREFMGGFTDFLEDVASSRGRLDLRRRVSDTESVSWWQSLTFGANYKAAYCLAVCPAGDDVIAPFRDNRPRYLEEIVRPLQQKEEPVYVVPGTDAEAYVARRFPHKTLRRVGQSLRPTDLEGMIRGMPILFQPGKAKGLAARFHFTFTGEVEREITIDIRDQRLAIEEGHHGRADLRVRADAATWVGYLRRERYLLPAILRGRIRVFGAPRLLLAFGKCFPR